MNEQRIEKVLTAICNHPDWIRDIQQDSNEYYFRYKQYMMSIARRPNNAFGFYIYPQISANLPVENVVAIFSRPETTESNVMKAYFSDDYEAEPFNRLYDLLETRVLGIDHIFTDILSDEDPDPFF